MDFQRPQLPQVTNNIQIPDVIQNAQKTATDTLTGMKDSITNTFNQFSNQPQGSTEYKFSNTIIAKFAFVILVLIVFMFLINLGIMLIIYFTAPASNPYLIKGMIDGTYGVIIPQDPKNSESVMILRSNNQSKGIEFTWDVWLYINDLNTQPNKYQHIFNKGDNNFNEQNISINNNAPGVYLGPSNNNLHIIMNTVDGNDNTDIIDISNIPIKKWFNLAIRLENTMLDVYINGTISSRLILKHVPKQNYNDVFVSQNGGFFGKLADLRYFSYALNVFEINRIVLAGPNTFTSNKTDDQKSLQSGYSYLSNYWYNSKI